jgi:hypothetical protein
MLSVLHCEKVDFYKKLLPGFSHLVWLCLVKYLSSSSHFDGTLFVKVRR